MDNIDSKKKLVKTNIMNENKMKYKKFIHHQT